MRSDVETHFGNGTTALGTFLNLGSALAAEACAIAGFQWLLVDLEHGGGGEEALVAQLLAGSAHGVPVIVRVETADRIRVGRALDLGAAGVMFPRLDSAHAVRDAIQHAYFPPEGDRGVATYNRACAFGLNVDTLDSANGNVLTIVQIETLSALEQVEEIALVEGVHALFVGPRDLSHALGIPGRVDLPEFQEALARVLNATRASGIAAGILAGSDEAARRYADQGFTLVGIGSDSSFLASAARVAAGALDQRTLA